MIYEITEALAERLNLLYLDGMLKTIISHQARAVLVDGKPYQKKADGSLIPLKGKTDWKRLDRMTSAQVEAIAASDKDGVPMNDEEWNQALA
jgi:hypothetical protein